MKQLIPLRELNPDKQIFSIYDPEFYSYGRVLNLTDLKPILDFSLSHFTDVEAHGTSYIASDNEMEKFPVVEEITRAVFGEFEVQTGCCFGFNSRMNGMEFHKSSEVLGAATDMVLTVGCVQDIKIQDETYTWNSNLTKFVFVPAGTMIELYATTLHLAPCRVSADPFNAVIILPKGTNTPLKSKPDGMLWMKNKWFLAHPDSPTVAKGSCIGISGPNHEIKINS